MTRDHLPTNAEIARRFALLADLLEIDGERSRHRLLAYRRGAARVAQSDESVAQLALGGRATDLPDIGSTLQDKIVELATTGEIGALTRISERVPPGLAEIAGLPGIGPKRARAVWEASGVTDLDGLRAAIADGALGTVEGIGPKTVRQLADELAARERGEGAGEEFPLGRAAPVAERYAVDLAGLDVVGRAVVAGGGLRRARSRMDPARAS